MNGDFMRKSYAFVFLILFFGCVRLKEISVNDSFSGLIGEPYCQNQMNLLIVHGIGGYSKGDPDTLIHAIERKLGLIQTSSPVVRDIIKDNIFYGHLIHTDYQGPYNNLRIYVLCWHSTTAVPRTLLQHIDDQYAPFRLPMVRKTKKNYINNPIADAILYVSSYRKEIQYPLEKTIEWINTERPCQDVTIVGFSLGSTMLIDTLDEMCNQELAINFIKQIKEIFMLSNPTPLFDLAKWDANCDASESNWEWNDWSIGRLVHEKRKSNPHFKIIAISDPNDAFSYVTNDYVPSDLGWEKVYINVGVRNVKWSFLGIVDPIEAHVGYGSNKTVLDLIVFGRQCCQ